MGLAGNLCYALIFGAPDDSAAFQDRCYRAFGIAAAYKVVVNIERKFDRDHTMMNPPSNRLRVLLLETLRLLVLRTLERGGQAHRVGEPVIEQS